jgi:hypothetical protein
MARDVYLAFRVHYPKRAVMGGLFPQGGNFPLPLDRSAGRSDFAHRYAA